MYRHRISHPATLKFNGSFGQEKAWANALNFLLAQGLISDFTYEDKHGRKDGESVDRTYYLDIEGAENYATRAEKKAVDKSGYVYLMRSKKTVGRFKLGTSIHVQQRVGEVNRTFEEEFEQIHSICSDDAYALEQALLKKYEAFREPDSTEFFWFLDQQVDEIRSK